MLQIETTTPYITVADADGNALDIPRSTSIHNAVAKAVNCGAGKYYLQIPDIEVIVRDIDDEEGPPVDPVPEEPIVVPPAPPPLPPSPPAVEQGSFIDRSELLVDGLPTDFDTQPPDEIHVHPTHPRLMFRAADIQGIRDRLGSPEWADELRYLQSGAADNTSMKAFLWQIFGDEAARDIAKGNLLSGNIIKWRWPYYDEQWVFVWAITYDWLADSLTPDEKKTAWAVFLERLRWDSIISGLVHDEPIEDFHYNNNDHFGKRPSQYEVLVALAIHGDGVDDEIASQLIEMARTKDRRVPNPWTALDWTNLIALDTGGSQMSHDITNLSGYSGFLAFTAYLTFGCWQSATGEDFWARSNYYRYFPLWNAYDRDHPLDPSGTGLMRILSCIYKDIDPDMAGLAAWYASGKYMQPEVETILPWVIWGDKTIEKRSPSDVGLPVVRYLRGADLWTSRTSWDDDAVVVSVTARAMDFLRYEPNPGCIWIYDDSMPVLTDSRKGKWDAAPITHSGINVGYWDEGKAGLNTASMYWKPPKKWRGLASRAGSPLEVASHPAYYPNTLEAMGEDWMTVRWESLSGTGGIGLIRRSVMHRHPYVIVFDEWIASQDTPAYMNWRLSYEPTITEWGWSWANAAASVLGDNIARPRWVGGPGSELMSPLGEWAGSGKDGYVPGYSAEIDRSIGFGMGNVYVESVGSGKCITVIEIGADAPPVIAPADDGWGVVVGGHAVKSTDGILEISNGV